jgi:PPP family 3-phenylpropionic acid transporter
MVSDMWIIMLLVELPLVAMIGIVQQKVGARGLLAVGVVAGSARWLLTAWSNDLTIIYAAQLLHGVTVMGLILGAPLYVDAVVPARLRSTAQGALAMAGVSLGGVLSNLMAGWMNDVLGPRAPALVGGLGALALAIAMTRLVPRPVGPGGRGDVLLPTVEAAQAEQSVEAGI